MSQWLLVEHLLPTCCLPYSSRLSVCNFGSAYNALCLNVSAPYMLGNAQQCWNVNLFIPEHKCSMGPASSSFLPVPPPRSGNGTGRKAVGGKGGGGGGAGKCEASEKQVCVQVERMHAWTAAPRQPVCLREDQTTECFKAEAVAWEREGKRERLEGWR